MPIVSWISCLQHTELGLDKLPSPDRHLMLITSGVYANSSTPRVHKSSPRGRIQVRISILQVDNAYAWGQSNQSKLLSLFTTSTSETFSVLFQCLKTCFVLTCFFGFVLLLLWRGLSLVPVLAVVPFLSLVPILSLVPLWFPTSVWFLSSLWSPSSLWFTG